MAVSSGVAERLHRLVWMIDTEIHSPFGQSYDPAVDPLKTWALLTHDIKGEIKAMAEETIYPEGPAPKFTEPTAVPDGSVPILTVLETGVEIGANTTIWHFTQVREGAVIGEECTIGSHVYIGKGVRIGRRCKIENFAYIPQGVTIEDGVFIGPHVVFTNDRYPAAVNDKGRKIEAEDWNVLKTHVGYAAVIGAGAVILPECDISSKAQIAAGSVVTHPVKSGALMVGNPARAVAGPDGE